MKPLNMEQLMDYEVPNLSGGELQRVAITLALGKPADVSRRQNSYYQSTEFLGLSY